MPISIRSETIAEIANAKTALLRGPTGELAGRRVPKPEEIRG
jgi:hypothetical protein